MISSKPSPTRPIRLLDLTQLFCREVITSLVVKLTSVLLGRTISYQVPTLWREGPVAYLLKAES